MYQNIDELKGYLKKIQRIINTEKIFKIRNIVLIKKSKIDDVMCCLYAILPESYKKTLSSFKNNKKYTSVIAYNTLVKSLTNIFFSKNIIKIDANKINSVLAQIILHIENDINNIEAESNN